MRKRVLLLLWLPTVLFFCTASDALATNEYVITGLGGNPGGGLWNAPASHAYGINDNNQVVGQAPNLVSKAGEATLFPLPSPGKGLGFLAGDTSSAAYDINLSGQIVGISGQRGFLYNLKRNTMTALGNLGPVSGGATYSLAYSINDAGQVVGYCSSPLGQQACIWQGRALAPTGLGFGLGGTQSEAADINLNGLVVGSTFGTQGYQAFVWQGGSMALLPNLTAGGTSRALGVNDSELVAGWSSTSTKVPVIWDKDFNNEWKVQSIDLPQGCLSGQANGMNNFGVVVGDSQGMIGLNTLTSTIRQDRIWQNDTAEHDGRQARHPSEVGHLRCSSDQLYRPYRRLCL